MVVPNSLRSVGSCRPRPLAVVVLAAPANWSMPSRARSSAEYGEHPPSSWIPVPSATRTKPLNTAIVAAASSSPSSPTDRTRRRRAAVEVGLAELDGVREAQQLGAVGHADVTHERAVDDTVVVDLDAERFAAHTEQRGVGRRSIEALVQRGGARGDQLDGRARQRPAPDRLQELGAPRIVRVTRRRQVAFVTGTRLSVRLTLAVVGPVDCDTHAPTSPTPSGRTQARIAGLGRRQGRDRSSGGIGGTGRSRVRSRPRPPPRCRPPRRATRSAGRPTPG